MKKSFKTVLISVLCLGWAIPALADGGALLTKNVEQKLKNQFHAENVVVTGMKEDYWGLYRSYQVSFKVHEKSGNFKVACHLEDRRPKALLLSDCNTHDAKGTELSEAQVRSLGLATRAPASVDWK